MCDCKHLCTVWSKNSQMCLGKRALKCIRSANGIPSVIETKILAINKTYIPLLSSVMLDSGPELTYEPFCGNPEESFQILTHRVQLLVSGTIEYYAVKNKAVSFLSHCISQLTKSMFTCSFSEVIDVWILLPIADEIFVAHACFYDTMVYLYVETTVWQITGSSLALC